MDSSIVENFKDHLLNNYLAHHYRKIRYSEYFQLIEFLTNNEIIPRKIIRIYTVLHEFKYLYEEKRYKNKTQLIKAIAQKYDLHENTVWNIVGNYAHYFERQQAEEFK